MPKNSTKRPRPKAPAPERRAPNTLLITHNDFFIHGILEGDTLTYVRAKPEELAPGDLVLLSKRGEYGKSFLARFVMSDGHDFVATDEDGYLSHLTRRDVIALWRVSSLTRRVLAAQPVLEVAGVM